MGRGRSRVAHGAEIAVERSPPEDGTGEARRLPLSVMFDWVTEYVNVPRTSTTAVKRMYNSTIAGDVASNRR